MSARTRRTFGNIRRLASGNYQVRYTAPDGYVKAPDTFTTRMEAERWLADRRREVQTGEYRLTAPKLSFGEYAGSWLASRHVAGRPIKARTRDHYSSILERHLLPTFGPRVLASITPADVRAWHAITLVDRPTMRSHAYSLLRTIFTSAVADELVDANPARITGAGASKRVHQIRPVSIGELGLLTQAMPDRLKLMVTLAYWCALRFGEIVELHRGDIDLSEKVIRIRRAAVRTKDGYEVTSPKSAAGVRDVTIPPHIIPAIEEHLASYVASERDALLFPAEGGGHLQPSTLYRHWYRVRAAAGRPDLRFHDLRHSSLVLTAATGATLAELMARAGHSTPTAAMRYQHVAAGRDREIASLLSKLASNTP